MLTTITTSTMHDALTLERLTTIYVDDRPTVQVQERRHSVPASFHLRSRSLLAAPCVHTFEGAVTYWSRLLAGNPTVNPGLSAE